MAKDRRDECLISKIIPTNTNVYIFASRVLYNFTSTLQFHEYFTISRVLYNFTSTLQFHEYFTISRVLYNFTSTLQFHECFTISRVLYNFTSTLQFHEYFTTFIRVHVVWDIQRTSRLRLEFVYPIQHGYSYCR